MTKRKKINYKVMRTGEFLGGDEPTVFYKLDCTCSSDDHILTFILEHDESMVSVCMNQQLSWSSYYGFNNIFGRTWRKIKAIIRLIFLDYIEVEGEVILQGEEHIQNFIDALEEGKEQVKKSREKYENKKRQKL